MAPTALKKVGAPRVRLELTTYRLTAGRAADCAIQETLEVVPRGHHKCTASRHKKVSKSLPTAGIEPATNRLKVERST